ncbi:MAG: sensor histidine kinase [Patescibacteria group bacterium]
MQVDRKWYQALLATVLLALAVSLLYIARDLHPFVEASARYVLFIPVIYAAHCFGVSGGITASLGLSTFLVPLVVGRALIAGTNTYGLEIAAAIVSLNLIGYSWGALAGAQRRQRQLYQELYEMAQHAAQDPRATALALLDAALDNVPADGGLVLLTIDPEFQLQVLASRGMTGIELRDLGAVLGRGETLIEWAIMAGRGMILNGVDRDPRFAVETSAAPRNLLLAPLSRGEEICGGIILFGRQGLGDFGRADLEWLIRLAERASVALENARLYAVSVEVAEENARYYRELKVYAGELDRLVGERTQALAEALENLRAAQADLLQTSRLAAVGELAGRVAHEILNPLTAVLGRVQMRLGEGASEAGERPHEIMAAVLDTWSARAGDPGGLAAYLDSPSPTTPGLSCGDEDLRDLRRLLELDAVEKDRHKKDMEFIETQMLRLVRLIEGLRELGRRTRSARAVDLAEAVGQAMEVMAPTLNRARVAASIDLPPGLPPVEADPDELMQVLTNLLRNAVQAIEGTGRGSGSIAVTGGARAGRVELAISDDGVGIPGENLERVFEAGFTTKPREQGTGLGLNISRRFMRECRGDLEIAKSTPGGGTTFLAWFPLPAGAETAAAREEQLGRDDH